jgi:hypothetical protein
MGRQNDTCQKEKKKIIVKKKKEFRGVAVCLVMLLCVSDFCKTARQSAQLYLSIYRRPEGNGPSFFLFFMFVQYVVEASSSWVPSSIDVTHFPHVDTVLFFFKPQHSTEFLRRRMISGGLVTSQVGSGVGTTALRGRGATCVSNRGYTK